MKGYWHFFALSTLLAVLTVIFDHIVFLLLLLSWLFYLFKQEKMGIIPVILSLFCYLGFSLYIPTVNDTDSMEDEQAIKGGIIGTIYSPVKYSEKKLEFILQEQTSNKKIIVYAFKEKNEDWGKQVGFLKHGAKCELEGLLELPDRSRNPGQFDYRAYLLSKGIGNQLTLASLENISCEGSSYLNYIFQLRHSLINYVISKTDSYTASWLNALVLGDDSTLDEETLELFQRWNLSHILAISGLHVALIISIIYFVLIKLNILSREKAQWLMVIILPFYAFIAGGEPSVWRSCLMVLIFIILHKIKVIYSLTDVLSIIFLLLILFDKYIVYHVGFQLSFLVTLGLLLSGKWIGSTKSPLFISLQISFVSQMMIIPLQLAYFHTLLPLSIIVNVLVVPYFSFFVIPFMFFILLLCPLPSSILMIFNIIFETINRFFINLIHFIDDIAYFPYILGAMPFYSVIIYYVLFLLLMNSIQLGKNKRSLKLGCLIVGLITLVAIRPYFSPYGTVTMLDIGQGDSFVIELPYRKGVYLIDAGAKMSFEDKQATDIMYEQVIKPYLYSNGISKIDAIFLSHEDADHVGSVPYLVNEIKVDRIYISEFYQLPEDTRKRFEKKHIKVQRLIAGTEFNLHQYPIQIISPHTNRNETNANSLVLHMKMGGENWLFTGDIDKQTEEEIIRNYPNLPIDVLKVAHHGSDTSTEDRFIQQYQPKFALISVGKNNSYGHPTKAVLHTLNEAMILRTDQDGAVQFKFTKNEGTFSKFLP